MAKWECLTQEEERMVRSLGHDPEPMVVDRVGEGHWMFLNMKSRAELIVSLDDRGRPRGTYLPGQATPPVWRR